MKRLRAKDQSLEPALADSPRKRPSRKKSQSISSREARLLTTEPNYPIEDIMQGDCEHVFTSLVTPCN